MEAMTKEKKLDALKMVLLALQMHKGQGLAGVPTEDGDKSPCSVNSLVMQYAGANFTPAEIDSVLNKSLLELANEVLSSPGEQDAAVVNDDDFDDEPHCSECGNDDINKMACEGTTASGTHFTCGICKSSITHNRKSEQ